MDEIMKKRTMILIVILFAVLLLSIAGFIITGYWLPYRNAISSFSGGRTIVMHQQTDGSVLLEWPMGINTDQYLVEILLPGKDTAEYSYRVKQNYLSLDVLPADGERTLRIQTAAEYRLPFQEYPQLRYCEDAIEITDIFAPPEIRNINWKPNPDTDQVYVTLDVDTDCTVKLYNITKGLDTPPEYSFTNGKTLLSFGDDQTWPLPAHHETYSFAFSAFRQKEGYIYYGLMTDSVSLVREDLLGTVLNLAVTAEKNNQQTFTWNETKGDYYQFQYRPSAKAEWETLTQIPADGELRYVTNSLDPYSYQEYRVVARDEEASELTPVAQSETIPVQVGSALIYSTIWPIKNLDLFADAQKTQTLGTVKKGTAFCVLDLENGMFKVRHQDSYGYIDSNYCMINLSEFLGPLCLYDITNSYESLYKIHEYDIPEVTGEVIIGYENILLPNSDYLVPLLYPTSLKLEQAALAAAKNGYTLKIYDSFRPQAATDELYKVAYEFSQEVIPEDQLPEDYIPEETEPGETLPPYTYALYMTDNGRYELNYFLAKGRSRHNQGVAMDMTLVNIYGELPMQTDIHDLSWHSETKLNEENANMLAKIMKSAGFNGLVSEWWHFQDDESVKAFDLPALWDGVTPECWMADENGWRYRRANGRYYTNCSAKIGGVEYRFNESGYVID